MGLTEGGLRLGFRNKFLDVQPVSQKGRAEACQEHACGSEIGSPAGGGGRCRYSASQTPVALLLSLSFSSTRDHLVTAPMLALEYLPSGFVSTRADLTCLTYREYVVTSPCHGSVPSTPWAEPTPTAEHGPRCVLTCVCAGPRDTKVGASPVPGGHPAFTKLQKDHSVVRALQDHTERDLGECLLSIAWCRALGQPL